MPRAASTRESDASETLPSGSSAGVPTALCRAKTPGGGSGPRCRPVSAYARTRSAASWAWLGFGVSRSRCASTIAPTAAVISSAEVTSKAKTYRENRMLASASMLPSLLTSERPTTVPRESWPTPTTRVTPRISPPRIANSRWPRIVSTTESEASTPTSISTKRNSIRIAPV